MLGLDPLGIANEGKVVAVVPPGAEEEALDALRGHPRGRAAAVVGRFGEESDGRCEILTDVGGLRVVTTPYGEDLPRIC
jgi:hydrogenase expression/formation protein HypE